MLNFEKAQKLFFEGLAFYQNNDFTQAEIMFLNALELVPDRVSVLTNLSTTQIKLRKFDQASDAAKRALAIDISNSEALVNLGAIEKEKNNFDQAIERFKHALQLKPDLAEAWLNIGLILHEQKRHSEALTHYDQALQLKPDLAEAWLCKGNALLDLECHEQALSQYEHALTLNNKFVLAIQGILKYHRKLNNHQGLNDAFNKYKPQTDLDHFSNELMGYVALDMGDKEKSFNYFNKARMISEQSRQTNNQTEWPILDSRIRHDYEQLEYLEEIGKNTETGKKALSILKCFINEKSPPSGEKKNNELLFAISHYHNVPDIPFSGRALGLNNYKAIENSFLNNKLRLVVIDNFLTEDALLNLRTYCEEANIWKRSYSGGYIGSFMGTGFCSRVVLAIAEELKLAMPNVIGSNTLSEAWGFKYDQHMSGINLHADFAKINTNFWITANDACLNKSRGGLLVYDVPAPNDWGFTSYNNDYKKIKRYLRENNSNFTRVTYRENRCVLFDSTYFHATDEMSFKEGYRNRRINCTLLYGSAL